MVGLKQQAPRSTALEAATSRDWHCLDASTCRCELCTQHLNSSSRQQTVHHSSAAIPMVAWVLPMFGKVAAAAVAGSVSKL